jgi:hypothetical protein
MTHELKIEKQWADAKLSGEKPFEVRINDRGFQKGDTVHYRVVDPKTHEAVEHNLSSCDFLITYVKEGAEHGLQPGYCVFADQPVPRKSEPERLPRTLGGGSSRALTPEEPEAADWTCPNCHGDIAWAWDCILHPDKPMDRLVVYCKCRTETAPRPADLAYTPMIVKALVALWHKDDKKGN